MDSPTGRALCILVVLALLAAGVQARAVVYPLDPDQVPEVLERVASVNRVYERDMVAYQEYDVRLLLMRWRFTGTVRKEGGSAHVDLEGAPSLFPQDISATLLHVAEWLETFEVEYQGLESVNGRPHHRFYGVPLAGERSQTRWGTIWVDPETFLINRIQVQYWWGRITIQQGFRSEGEYVLLDRQSARIDPLGIRADIRWKEYRFLDRP